jgi:beta-lactam-binding protein with PASTA domain
VFRDGRWRADNGNCRGTRTVLYFTGKGPGQRANCKPNEVEVPRVTGMTYDKAVERLALQPLEAEPIFKPAVPRQRVGYVIGQIPRVGARLSAYDTVQLVVAKPIYGVVPRVVGLPLPKARERLEDRQLRVIVRRKPAKGKPGRVLSQRPQHGVAAAPQMRVTVVVAAPAG